MHRADSTVVWVLVALTVPVAAHAQSHREVIAPGVTYEQRAEAGAHLHVTYVDLCDPHVSIRVSAPDEGARTVRAWATAHHAVAAINGDYFDAHTLLPLGPSRGAGTWWPAGRRMHRDALLGFRVGGAPVLFTATGASRWPDAERVVGTQASEVIAAREQVLVAGEVHRSAFVSPGHARHPRTAVGLSRDRHVLVLLVVEGHTEGGSGVRADELGTLLRTLGAWDGFKLDGGGSSTLVIRGHTVNHPSDGRDRVVANMLGVIESDAPHAHTWCAP